MHFLNVFFNRYFNSVRLTELGSYAFNSTGLTHLFIPKELKSIGEAAFGNCGNLTDISCSEGSKTYRAEGNCLIKKKNLIFRVQK